MRLLDWLKRYKTSNGMPENTLEQDEPTSVKEAMEIIEETHLRWRILCGKADGATIGDAGKTVVGTKGFIWIVPDARTNRFLQCRFLG